MYVFQIHMYLDKLKIILLGWLTLFAVPTPEPILTFFQKGWFAFLYFLFFLKNRPFRPFCSRVVPGQNLVLEQRLCLLYVGVKLYVSFYIAVCIGTLVGSIGIVYIYYYIYILYLQTLYPFLYIHLYTLMYIAVYPSIPGTTFVPKQDSTRERPGSKKVEKVGFLKKNKNIKKQTTLSKKKLKWLPVSEQRTK